MALKQQARHGTFWLVGSQIINIGVTFLVAIFLARILEIYQFGLLTLSTVVFIAGTVLTTGIFRETVIIRQDLERDTISALFWLNVGASLVVGAVLFAAAGPITRLLDAPEFEAIMWLTVGSIVVSGFGAIPYGIRYVNKDFARIGLQTAVLSVGLVPVVVAMALWGYGALSAATATFIYHCVTCAVNWHCSGWRPQWRVPIGSARPARSTVLVLLGQQSLDVVNSQFDRAFIGGILGPRQLGLYSIGRRLNDLITDALISPSLGVTTPLIASIRDDTARLRSAYVQTLSLATILAVPANLGLLAVGDLAIAVLFGDKWLEATPVLRAFACIGLLGVISGVQRSVVHGGGKPETWLRIQAAHTVGNMAAMIAMAPFGIIAIVYAMVVRALLLAPLGFVAASRMTGIGTWEHVRIMLAPLQAGLAMVLLVLVARTALPQDMMPILQLAILVVVGAAAYLIIFDVTARVQFRHALELIVPKASGALK